MEKKQTFKQIATFTLFSISAGVIQAIVFTILNESFNITYYLAYSVALAASVVWNFTFNRKFTFKEAHNVPKAMLLAFLFYVPFAPLSIWGGGAMESAGVNEYLVLALTMVCNLALEFVWQKYVVFKKQKQSHEQSLEK